MTYKEWFTRTTARFDIESADVELILANQQNTIPNPEEAVDVVTGKTAKPFRYRLVIPCVAVGSHQPRTRRRKPRRESVCDTHSNLFQRFFVSELLYKGVTVQSLNRY